MNNNNNEPNNNDETMITLPNGNWWCPACGQDKGPQSEADYLTKGRNLYDTTSIPGTSRRIGRQRLCRPCCVARIPRCSVFPDDHPWIFPRPRITLDDSSMASLIPQPDPEPAPEVPDVPVRDILGLEPAAVTVQERVEAIETPVQGDEVVQAQPVVAEHSESGTAETAVLMTPTAITAMINAEIDARIAAGTLGGLGLYPTRPAAEPRQPRVRAPRAAGPGTRGTSVDRQEFYDNAPVHQEVQHKFKGITATAIYVGPGNKFQYRSPDGVHDKEAGISAFPVAHIKYLLRAGLITTGSLSWNGWDACNLPGRRKKDWTLDHLTAG